MNDLSVTQNLTMSSYELWKVINKFRQDDGANKVRHDDFLARVADECDDLGVCETFAVPSTGVKLKAYQLNHDQILLVGMRESKAVRKKVLAWLKKTNRESRTTKNTDQLCRSSTTCSRPSKAARVSSTKDRLC